MSALRFAAGFVWMALVGVPMAVTLLLLLPSYGARVRVANRFARAVGKGILFFSGARLALRGEEQLDADRPVIYAMNHSSMLDVPIAISLGPNGTTGVGKAGVKWVPVFGQLYVLAGNLLLDRGNRERAATSLARLADKVRTHRLSIFFWPEGTRSGDGRLGPFKKGLYHLAVATQLPIVPVVVEGVHRVLPKGSLTFTPGEIGVRLLPPVDVGDWGERTAEACMAQLRDVFAAALPEDQRPVEA